MSDQKIIDKIRKLLRLSRGTPNPGEADAALAMAQKLLLEHGLSMSAADSDTDRGFRQESVFEGKRIPPESRFVFQIVCDYFFCHPIEERLEGGRVAILLIGRPEHLAVGRYVGVYLSRTYRALWTVYKQEHRITDRERRGYYMGLTLGIGDKLRRDRREIAIANKGAGALIVSNERAVADEIEKRFGTLTKPRTKKIQCERNTLRDGFVRGQNVQINKALPQACSQPRLL